ncbi:uncharacterized protein PITG_16025 [Phytophthora infestans T30-4]|uniref:PiggyBac transposable element-derived protein domain-containing protein n=1 Tax=Phytophthora infestans (strain T30-4) TaxID=403677 RepID=D0NSP4_PHYIT|nr:uncharacterized protein PITG_16025 [Phytophthora infestans T30-4]EEY64606.1 hypothetical protein PITG_16025 [Phytophthora infestans T30-4]|eukprot:XP_002897806.1 hypothetical protein PITG_16025 [Phytophthora infestans T30-4]
MYDESHLEQHDDAQMNEAGQDVPVARGQPKLNEIATKARSMARTYMPSKPDKYGVRLYAVVDWNSLYVHTLRDNASVNTQPTTPAQQ